MTSEPRTRNEVYESLRDSLTGKITKLSNFTTRSFNYVWTQAISEEIRRIEVKSTVSELAGWIDYTGGPITEEDLESLDLDEDVTVDEVNEFMREDYLDEYVKILGIDRLPGTRATGSVEFETQTDVTTIPSGTVVTTEPDSQGNTINFITVEEAQTIDGVTTTGDVPIQAEEVGVEHNLPAGTIVRLADPPLGVSGVTNVESTTGGTERESNSELRERSKKVVQSSSLGGTSDGIKGYIRQNVEGVDQGDIVVDEFTNEEPPFVDVIVDGGLDDQVIDAISFSRPTGIEHNLIRPEIVQIGIDIDLTGTDINTSSVSEDINNFLLNAGIGENFYNDEFINIVMNSDDNIINIDNIGGVIERVTNETFTFSDTQSEYQLEYTYEDSNGSIEIEDSNGTIYTEGVEFSVNDQTGDGWPETIVWTGATPNNGEKFFVNYDVTVVGQTDPSDEYSINLVRDEVFEWNESVSDTLEFDNNIDVYQLSSVPFDGTTSISDGSGDTYAEGADYDLVDDTGNGYNQSIDWSIGGGQPDDNESFTVNYEQKVYLTEYEHRDTPSGIIRDDDGDVYQEDTEYITVDYTQDGEEDAIDWQTNPASISDGDEFYFTYFTEGDIKFRDRQKADPGTVLVEDNDQ